MKSEKTFKSGRNYVYYIRNVNIPHGLEAWEGSLFLYDKALDASSSAANSCLQLATKPICWQLENMCEKCKINKMTHVSNKAYQFWLNGPFFLFFFKWSIYLKTIRISMKQTLNLPANYWRWSKVLNILVQLINPKKNTIIPLFL